MMGRRIAFRLRPHLTLLLLVLGVVAVHRSALGAVDPDVEALIAKGEYREAEERLEGEKDPAAPPPSEAATRLEILRRTRQDFRYTDKDVLAQLKTSIPDVTQEDIDRWREAGDLQARTIDGE